MSDAKDEEIHRLRGWLDRVLYKTGCTRGQRTTQWCDEAVEAHRELREAQAEIERLRARVGWLDHLDTEEGRHTHANEALLVENEQLKAELAKLKEAT